MNFSGFYGNQNVKDRLTALAAAGRFPHALILEGPAGSGKRTLARLIAQWMLCTGQGERPCGACPNCKKAAANGHPDLFIAAGGEGARSFHIDVIRRIREEAAILPNEGAVKVYLLENAGVMTEQAQNALLKVLEEPPKHVRFLLTCEASSQLLPTILSRAPVLSLENLPQKLAEQALCQMRPQLTQQQAQAAAALWDGNLGRMLESLQDGVLARAEAIAAEIAAAIPAQTELPLLSCTIPLLKDKALTRATLSRFILFVRDCLLLRSGVAMEERQRGQALAARLTKGQLLRLLEAAQQSLAALDRYANQTLLITVFCARLRRAAAKA